MKIAMIGSGGWGTAMVTSLAARHDDLELYCRREEAARELKETRENKEYLPGVRIPVHVKITSDLEKAVSGADCVVLSTPSKAVEITAEAMAPFMKKNAVAVCASKGLADEAGHRLSEIISEKFSSVTDRIVVLSGPNHAEEVGLGLPAATVAASEVPEAVQIVQDVFYNIKVYIELHSGNRFYCYSATSIIVVLAGTLMVLTPKNSVFAVKSSPSKYSALVLVSTCQCFPFGSTGSCITSGSQYAFMQ